MEQEIDTLQSWKILRKRVIERLSHCPDQTEIAILIDPKDLLPGFSLAVWQSSDHKMEPAIIKAVENRPAVALVILRFPGTIPNGGEVHYEIPGRG